MSNIHIREKDKENKTITCVFHFLVPAATNAIGMAWNEVLQKAKNPIPIMSDNDTTENASISAGSILEIKERVRFSSTNLTNIERIAEIEAKYTTRQSEVFAELAAELDFFGEVI